MSTAPRLTVVVAVVVLAACGEYATPAGSETTGSGTTGGPTTSTFVEVTGDVTGTTSIDGNPFACQLPVSLRINLGAALGTIEQIEGPYVGEPPDEALSLEEGRQFWIIDLLVSEVVEGSFDRAIEGADNPLPSLNPGADTRVVLLPDLQTTPLEELQAVADGSSPVLLLLGGSGPVNQPDHQGIWFLRRGVKVEGDGGIVFVGACGAELGTEMTNVASALDRPADLDFLIDFQQEVLSHYGDHESMGPIEETAFSLYDSEPPPPEGP